MLSKLINIEIYDGVDRSGKTTAINNRNETNGRRIYRFQEMALANIDVNNLMNTTTTQYDFQLHIALDELKKVLSINTLISFLIEQNIPALILVDRTALSGRGYYATITGKTLNGKADEYISMAMNVWNDIRQNDNVQMTIHLFEKPLVPPRPGCITKQHATISEHYADLYSNIYHDYNQFIQKQGV